VERTGNPVARRSGSSDDGSHRLNNISPQEMQVAILQDRYDQLMKAREEDRQVLEEIREELSNIHDMANRWKGGFVVVVALGAFVGWVLSNLESALKLFGKG
jgi:hypothetical protein